ncbi:MAG: FAD-dependent oxidoreductase [Nitrospinota bacterium]
MKKKIVILGGGPCGLTAAWELAKNGADVTVVEREPSVGGLCKTTREKGYQFDLGGHRFISKDDSLVRDVQELMKGRLIARTRKSVITMDGREIEYPIHWQNIFTNYSFKKNMNFFVGYILSNVGFSNSKAPSGSFEKWVDKKFGAPLNQVFFKPYTEKLWGIKASELSDDWAAQRITLLSAMDLVLRATGLKKTPARGYAKTFLYPLGGIGEIFETMAAEIERLGGKVLTSSEPREFEIEDSQISGLKVVQKESEERTLKANTYLSTIPLNSLMPLLGVPSFSKLKYRSLRFLNIKLKREDFSDNTWMYVPGARFKMTRIQEPKRRSPESAPPGKTSLILEIPCNKGDLTWNMEEAALLKIALHDMKSLGFSISAEEVEGCFSTWEEHAYPCYQLGYKEKVRAILDNVSGFANLSTLGRQGLFRYIFMDTAMLMGREWARAFLLKAENRHIMEMDNAQVLLEGQSVV